MSNNPYTTNPYQNTNPLPLYDMNALAQLMKMIPQVSPPPPPMQPMQPASDPRLRGRIEHLERQLKAAQAVAAESAVYLGEVNKLKRKIVQLEGVNAATMKRLKQEQDLTVRNNADKLSMRKQIAVMVTDQKKADNKEIVRLERQLSEARKDCTERAAKMKQLKVGLAAVTAELQLEKSKKLTGPTEEEQQMLAFARKFVNRFGGACGVLAKKRPRVICDDEEEEDEDEEQEPKKHRPAEPVSVPQVPVVAAPVVAVPIAVPRRVTVPQVIDESDTEDEAEEEEEDSDTMVQRVCYHWKSMMPDSFWDALTPFWRGAMEDGSFMVGSQLRMQKGPLVRVESVSIKHRYPSRKNGMPCITFYTSDNKRGWVSADQVESIVPPSQGMTCDTEDANHSAYSVETMHKGKMVTHLQIYADRICVYSNDKMIDKIVFE